MNMQNSATFINELLGVYQYACFSILVLLRADGKSPQVSFFPSAKYQGCIYCILASGINPMILCMPSSFLGGKLPATPLPRTQVYSLPSFELVLKSVSD